VFDDRHQIYQQTAFKLTQNAQPCIKIHIEIGRSKKQSSFFGCLLMMTS
jgi:hypothetical protein